MTTLNTRIFIPRMSRGLTTHGTVMVADLVQTIESFMQGTVVYLSTPQESLSSDVGSIIRSVGGKLCCVEIPWAMLRNPRYTYVPAHIADHCWQGSEEERAKLLTRVLVQCLPVIDDFSPQFDISSL